jgi:NADPH:quinone reductase
MPECRKDARVKERAMLAAVFERAGDANQVVQLRQIPVPIPERGEVLVQMQAASLHPADRMFIRGSYRIAPVYPQRAGLVGTGVIAGRGADVDLKTGTRVAFRHPGAWAEYCVLPAARLFVVPDTVDVATAGQFALNPVTAWGLLDAAAVSQGDWLAVNAAGSNVAMMLRALAALRGLRVVEIPRESPSNCDSGREGDQGVARCLLAATGGEPIAAFLDAVGGAGLVEVLPALRQGAAIVSYGLLDDAPAPLRNADLIYRNLSWIGFGVDHWLARRRGQRNTMVRELWSAIATGSLPMPVRASFPLAALDVALQADAAAGPGKVVVAIGHDA